MNIRDLQQWIEKEKKLHFAKNKNAIYDARSRLINIQEEVGELAREERLATDFGLSLNTKLAMGAVGDIFIALVGYCIAREWCLDDIVMVTWDSLVSRWRSGQLIGTKEGEENADSDFSDCP